MTIDQIVGNEGRTAFQIIWVLCGVIYLFWRRKDLTATDFWALLWGPVLWTSILAAVIWRNIQKKREPDTYMNMFKEGSTEYLSLELFMICVGMLPWGIFGIWFSCLK